MQPLKLVMPLATSAASSGWTSSGFTGKLARAGDACGVAESGAGRGVVAGVCAVGECRASRPRPAHAQHRPALRPGLCPRPLHPARLSSPPATHARAPQNIMVLIQHDCVIDAAPIQQE
eukprot:1868402-Rhodomonas_salina.3